VLDLRAVSHTSIVVSGPTAVGWSVPLCPTTESAYELVAAAAAKRFPRAFAELRATRP
jgi:hypothetical protein